MVTVFLYGMFPLQNQANAMSKSIAHGTSTLTVRSTPNGKYIGKLAKNEPFYIYGQTGSWYKIMFNHKYAYTYKTHVSKSKPPLWYKGYAGSRLTVYDINTSKSVGTLPKNEPINVYAQQGSQLSIAYKTGYAHVNAKSVKKGSPKVWYTGYAADQLVVHDQYSDKVIGTQSLASKVSVYAQQGNWLTIGYKGKYAHTYYTHVSRYLKKGIDIGNAQHLRNNPIIDFKKVKAAGYGFVAIKTTGGLLDVNPYFQKDLKDANAAGLKTSVYHMFNATSTDKAKKEAEYFASKLKGQKITGYVFVDVEYENLLKQTTRENLTSYVNTFYQRLNQLGYKKIGIYTSTSILQYELDEKKLNKGMLLWVARWGNTLGRTASMWQYTSKGKVPGIQGNVDIDVAYTNKIGG